MFNFKFFEEKRAEYETEMQELIDTAEVEERALGEEETARFNELEKKIKSIDETLECEKRARALTVNKEPDGAGGAEDQKTSEEVEERAFCDYVRGVVTENRAEVLVSSEKGAVIPTSIAQKIIKKVEDISPLYKLATKYNAKGSLNVPYYDEIEGAIEMDYATESQSLIAGSGKFKSIELKGFLAGALAKIPKTLVNNSDFDITSFIVNDIAEKTAKWMDKEGLNGTADKIDGISKAKQVVTAAAQTAIVPDELIDLQEEVPDMFQPGCIWIMNKATRTAIRKLKDKDDNYILNKDATSRWGYTLFGQDVYTSDNMPKMEAGKTAIIYGDLSGVAMKISEEMNIEVLRELFAAQHCLGAVGWIEVDMKIENEQKIAVLKMAAGE